MRRTGKAFTFRPGKGLFLLLVSVAYDLHMLSNDETIACTRICTSSTFFQSTLVKSNASLTNRPIGSPPFEIVTFAGKSVSPVACWKSVYAPCSQSPTPQMHLFEKQKK